MASVGNSLFSNPVNAGTSSTAKNQTPAASSGTDSLANEQTFLQLLVAQLKNQDPSQPMDGTTFVTQLAQFADLEQNLAARTDLDSISQQYTGTNSNTGSTTGTTPTSGS
jgi:flagellar basal-body rod modification protein FlgD